MMKISASFLLVLSMVTSWGIAEDWPQWRGPQANGMWTEQGIVTSFAQPQLPIKWRMPIGPGYNGPTVADGRVYVMDRQQDPEQTERVLCFNANNGESLWLHEYPCEYQRVGYDAGPRACVRIDQGRTYSLGSMGHLFCLDAIQGEVLWQHDLNQEYQIKMPIWGISASPLIVDDIVMVHIGGSPDACVVAFDKVTGQERWSVLSDRGQYSTPVLVQQAGQAVVIVWTGDAVHGLNPKTGESFWTVPFPPKNMPIGVATPVVSGYHVFLTSFYDGSMLLRLKEDTVGVEKIWHRVGASERKTDALQSIISTPIIIDDYVYGVDSYGELRCLDLASGDRVWEDLTATPKARWSTLHMVQNADHVWMFNERGELLITKLSPQGLEEISRSHLIDPTQEQLSQRGGVCWSFPAFANRCVFARNDKEIVCADLSANTP